MFIKESNLSCLQNNDVLLCTHMFFTSIIFFLLSLGCSQCLGQIQVTDSGSGFTVSFNGLDLLQHDQQGEPLFSVGKGVFEAVYDQGNYDVNDTVTEKYGLDEYDFGKVIYFTCFIYNTKPSFLNKQVL